MASFGKRDLPEAHYTCDPEDRRNFENSTLLGEALGTDHAESVPIISWSGANFIEQMNFNRSRDTLPIFDCSAV